MQTNNPIATAIKLNVLLADDNPIIQRLCGYTLAELHCQVTAAISGKQTMELLEQQSYDVLFLDIALDDKSGLELANKLRQAGYRLPIIALCPSGAYIPRMMQADINACINKPFIAREALRIFRKLFPTKFY